jgi:hypothetical protein
MQNTLEKIRRWCDGDRLIHLGLNRDARSLGACFSKVSSEEKSELRQSELHCANEAFLFLFFSLFGGTGV